MSMAERIEAFDWANTPIGPRTAWPPTLRIMVDTLLKNAFPMLIWWGPQFVQIYNDAYGALVGKRHPHALGQTAEACWPELWAHIGPIINDVYATAKPFGGEDYPFVLERNGYPEQTYFTFSYSRIGTTDDERGVLVTNVETTASVERAAAFRAMADNIANIIYTHSADGTIEWTNLRWYEYTQLPREIATTPAGWERVVPRDDLTLLSGKWQHAFAHGEAYEAEIRFKPDGADDSAYRWHLLRAVPMRGIDGTLKGWAGSATDIHDRRIAAEILREQLQRDLDREHQASLAFQKAALPQSLPNVPGLQFDAIYEAAGTDALVGGDWYDAFRLADGRVVLSVGDVIGSGLGAAVTMSAARQAIRGAAQVFPEPAAVLDAADRALRSEQPDRIVTAFLGILDPLTRTLSYASAGHPPPLLRTANGEIIALSAPDLPLGLRTDRPSSAERAPDVVLPEGALLVLYTDGLTEATHDVIAGEENLRSALGDDNVYLALDPAAAIRRAVISKSTDDVAILTVRMGAPTERITRWSFDSDDAATATRVRHQLSDILRSVGANANETADAELVFGELLGNVVRHTSGMAEAALDLSGDAPVLHVLDRGPGFTFYARLPNDSMSESGRGLFITTMLARDVTVVPRMDGGSHARVVLNVHSTARARQLSQVHI